jgi:hypothetical protein
MAPATAEPEYAYHEGTQAKWLFPQEKATFHNPTQGPAYSGSAPAGENVGPDFLDELPRQKVETASRHAREGHQIEIRDLE